MPTDIQYKNDLRKELIMFERHLKLAKEGKIEELIRELETEIDRVNASLQD